MAILDELRELHKQAKELAGAVADNVLGFAQEFEREHIPGAILEDFSFTFTIFNIGAAITAGLFIYIMHFIPPVVLAVGLWSLRQLAVPGVKALLDLLGLVRKELEPALDPVIAATLSELLGVEFTEADVTGGASPADRLARMEAIGARITETLEKEFVPDQTVGLQPGAHGVNAFLGFNVNFAVANAFISVMGEALSAGQMEEFRELGVTLAQNLGLGRLSRRGLSELVGTTVATPYEWHLNKKYRPTGLKTSEALEAYRRDFLTSDELAEKLARDGYSADKIAVLLNLQRTDLTAPQAINAFFRGMLDDDQLLLRLRHLGYGDTDLNALVELARPSLSVAQLWNLVNWGVLSRDQAIEELKLKGWSGLEAELVLKDQELGDANGRVREWVNKLEKWLLDGFITRAQFNTAIDELPLGREEKRWEKDLFLDVRCIPQKRMTKSESERAFIEGLITLSEYEAVLCREGYPEQDRLLLIFLLLLDAKSREERQRRRDEAERRRREEQQQQQSP